MKFSLVSRRYIAATVSVFLLTLVFVTVGVDDVALHLQELPLSSVLLAFICVLTTPFWVTLRFWRILAHFGVRVSWKTCLRASSAGQVASLVVMPLFGQVAGRQLLLARSGLSPESNAALAAYERVATALISGAAAMLGAVHLSGLDAVERLATKVEFVPAMLAIIAGLLISCWIGLGKFERSMLARLTEPKNIRNLLEMFFISFAGYAAMILAFFVLFRTLVPTTSVMSLLAGAAIVSFAASMPISVGGWGLREVAAVYVFGKFGVPAAHALAISVIIGLLSTLAVLLVAAVASGVADKIESLISSGSDAPKHFEIDRVASWGLGLAVAILLFFQIHIPLGATTTNINLADPFAVLALVAVTLGAIISRRTPQWNASGFNRVLLVFSVLWLIGFGWGWRSIGYSQWAFVGRLLGWLVLMGYLAAGYLIVTQHGRHGVRRTVETLAAVAAAVVLVHAVTRLILPIVDPSRVVLGNFEGFAQNRNAFAFQMLTVLSLVAGSSCVFGKFAKMSNRVLWLGVLLGIVLVGLVWSASRTGMIAAFAVLAVAWGARIADRRMVLVAAAVALVLWLAPLANSGSTTALQSHMSYEASDAGRWSANAMAFEAWKQSPLLGIGLGGFLAISPERFGFPMVIHSTPLWILAELGLVGVFGLAYAAYIFAKHLHVNWRRGSQNRSLLLLLIAFSLFCLLHEILFQRIFWFALGILLARPALERGSADKGA